MMMQKRKRGNKCVVDILLWNKKDQNLQS